MYNPFSKIKLKLDLTVDEGKKNELMYDALKEILRENVCKNRGYILTGIPISEEEINLLYWSNNKINLLARTLKPLEEGDEGYEPPEEIIEEEEEEEKKNEIINENIEKPEKLNIEDNPEEEEVNQNEENNKIAENVDIIVENNENNLPKKKKKPPKPIKYKTIVTFNKDLIPESVITIRRRIYYYII